MGQEFGQWNEWSEEKSLDWYLLTEPLHIEMREFTKKCFNMYKEYAALYETDYSEDGFKWINANDKDNSTLSFVRVNPTNKKHLLFVLNFTPIERENFKIGAPVKGKYKLILGSDEKNQKKSLTAIKGECDGYEVSGEIQEKSKLVG